MDWELRSISDQYIQRKDLANQLNQSNSYLNNKADETELAAYRDRPILSVSSLNFATLFELKKPFS